ncbi:MAG: PepSY domain-containing protein [Fluviicoccus sp.]|uniref:PepSY domain-containing protein n=1 Tax=Fluviicoccus sp. TaxID=2003552 RepID=UPI0027285207|nr:PepSY domain-containing protein [Fluviicoccus sp.]MDO8332020.1 PepSY domain-containing protein [Fluviicoccus sp.]
MTMLRTAGLAALLLVSGFTHAAATCPAYPKTEWMKEADARAKLVKEGYTIKKFKVSGECYELYGKDKAGKRVEIYFDAKTMAVVKKAD